MFSRAVASPTRSPNARRRRSPDRDHLDNPQARIAESAFRSTVRSSTAPAPFSPICSRSCPDSTIRPVNQVLAPGEYVAFMPGRHRRCPHRRRLERPRTTHHRQRDGKTRPGPGHRASEAAGRAGRRGQRTAPATAPSPSCCTPPSTRASQRGALRRGSRISSGRESPVVRGRGRSRPSTIRCSSSVSANWPSTVAYRRGDTRRAAVTRRSTQRGRVTRPTRLSVRRRHRSPSPRPRSSPTVRPTRCPPRCSRSVGNPQRRRRSRTRPFWRNARTHTLHDPVRWKYQHIGRAVLARRAAAAARRHLRSDQESESSGLSKVTVTCSNPLSR